MDAVAAMDQQNPTPIQSLAPPDSMERTQVAREPASHPPSAVG